jgi:hypothetical protein
MKTLNIRVCQVILLIFIGFCFSCKKNELGLSPQKLSSTSDVETPATQLTTIFEAEKHSFTDIQTCYDGKVFLLEDGILKRLNGSKLEEVLPASVYTDFKPKYLAISKDFTFYLRAPNGIKVIKGGTVIKYYKVGVAPLQYFTVENFGNWELSVDESDQSIIFGVTNFNQALFSLGKLTKGGQYSILHIEGMSDDFDLFITSFGIGGKPGVIWDCGLAAFNDLYYGILFKSTMQSIPYGYTVLSSYGTSPTNHTGGPPVGAIDIVQFQVMGCIEISKDGKILYYKTGVFHSSTGVEDNGQIYKIADDQVSLIAENINGKRLAISNDGKTLYIAGNGLFKIDF